MSNNDNDKVFTSMARMNHPDWRSDRPLARLRMGEGECYVLYAVLASAEQEGLIAYHAAVTAGDAMGAKQIRHATRRVERLRRRVLGILKEMDWNLPR